MVDVRTSVVRVGGHQLLNITESICDSAIVLLFVAVAYRQKVK